MEDTVINEEKLLTKQKSKRKKIIIIIGIVLAVLILIVFLVIPYSVSVPIYKSVFNARFTTSENFAYHVEEFDGLKADRYEFQSYDDDKLVGYRYYTEDTKPCGVVVIAHGLGGGGHNSYMDIAYYFACNGFDVFAYDATGNDESGGNAVKGLPQGVKDLSRAIEFLDEIAELKDLPVFLWGHSWGGYCVANVLNFHPEVKAIVSMAGFNRSSDLLYAQGKEMVGGIMDFFLPYINSYERMNFGKYAKATAMSGFENSAAGVYIVHSTDDTTVPIQYGYNIYYEKYATDKRFVFKQYENKRHNMVYCSQEAIDYMDAFYKKWDEYFEGKEVTKEENAEYIKTHLDRDIWCNLIDKELFADIVSFYKSHL